MLILDKRLVDIGFCTANDWNICLADLQCLLFLLSDFFACKVKFKVMGQYTGTGANWIWKWNGHCEGKSLSFSRMWTGQEMLVLYTVSPQVNTFVSLVGAFNPQKMYIFPGDALTYTVCTAAAVNSCLGLGLFFFYEIGL